MLNAIFDAISLLSGLLGIFGFIAGIKNRKPAVIFVGAVLIMILLIWLKYYNTNIYTNIIGQTQRLENNVLAVSNNAEYADITKWTVSSSSTLANEGKLTYYSSNIYDRKLSTSWVEGMHGSGIGEWVMLITNNGQKLKGIKIINGYASNMEFYKKNNRAKSIRVELSDGTIVEKQLEDSGIAWQYVDFNREIVCNSIKITILSVYRGNKYDDTCISEIDLY